MLGYFKELEALSSYTNSELKGYLGGYFTAAAALKAHPLSKEIASFHIYVLTQKGPGNYRVNIQALKSAHLQFNSSSHPMRMFTSLYRLLTSLDFIILTITKSTSYRSVGGITELT